MPINIIVYFIIILFNLIYISPAQATIDIFPKDLLLFTEAEHNDIKRTFPSPDGSKAKNEERLQQILTQIVRTVALTKCREETCDKNTNKKCVDFTDFELEISPISPKSVRKRIIIGVNPPGIAILPSWQNHDTTQDHSKQGFYLTKISCTDTVKNEDLKGVNQDSVTVLKDENTNLSPPPSWKREPHQCDPLLDPYVATLSKELQDWQEISTALAKGAVTSIAEGYSDFKDTLRYCPKEAIQSCFYRGISLVSFGASSWATTKAGKIDEIMRIRKASKGKAEPNEYRIQRLEKTYLGRKDEFSPEDQKSIESMFAGIPARLNYDQTGDLPKLLDRIEDALKLPKVSRYITPEQGEELRKKLKELNYPEEFIEHAYNMAAYMAVSTHYKVYIPIRPFYIIGYPGVGKTSFVEHVARILNLPLCIVKVKEITSASEELFGALYGKSGLPIRGLLIDCFTHQRDADGNALSENVDNPILVFDELDRVLNNEQAGAIRAQLLGIFNNSERDQRFQAAGLQNLNIDISKSPKFVLANDKIQPMKNIATQKGSASTHPDEPNQFDAAFKNRMNVLEMKPVDPEAKRAIANQWKDEAIRTFRITTLNDDIAKNHEDILKYDKDPGLRVLKSLVFENIATQAARKLGWRIKAINVEKAYSEIQENEEIAKELEGENGKSPADNSAQDSAKGKEKVPDKN